MTTTTTADTPTATKPATTNSPAENGDGCGSVAVTVSPAPLNIAAETQTLAAAAKGETGGCAYFLGIARGGEVAAMTLEHYPGMTERALENIARRACEKWKLHNARIVHRVGRILPGEAIVFVGAAAAHRSAAFEACRFMTDFLKTRAPFWKKEETVDGGSRWVQSSACDEDAAREWEQKNDGDAKGIKP